MAGKTIKGLMIEIGGNTSNLGKALKDVESKSKSASKEITEINTALKLVPDSEELLIQKQEALAKEIEATSGKLDILKEAEKQVQAQFERGEVSEEQLRALQREIVVTANELNGYEKAAEETAKALETASASSEKAGSSTVTVGTEAKNAAGKMDSLGEETEGAAKSLDTMGDEADHAGSKLDAAAVAVGAFIGNLALDVLKSAVSELKDLAEEAVEVVKGTAEYGDTIDKMSQKLGMTAEAYQEWDFILQHSGSSIDQMTGAAKKLADAVAEPTKASAEAFDRLGISIEDAAKLSQEELFETVIGKLQEMESGAERTAIANDLLGKSAIELGPLLNTSAEDMEAMRQQVHDLGGIMSDEAVRDSAAFQDALQNLTTAGDGLKRGFAAKIIPAAAEGMEELTGILTGGEIDEEKLIGIIEQIADTVEDTLADIGGAAEKLAPVVEKLIADNLDNAVTFGKDLLVHVVSGAVSALPDALTAVLDIADTLLDGILNALPELLTKLAEAVTEAAPLLAERIPQLLQTLEEGLMSAQPALLQAAFTMLTAIVSAVPLLVQNLTAVLPDIVTGIISVLISSIPQLQDGAYTLLLAILDAIPPIIEALAPLVPEIVTALIDLLLDSKDELGDTALQMFELLLTTLIQVGEKLLKILWTYLLAIIKNIGTFGPRLLDQLRRVADDLLSIIRGLADKMRGAGHNVMAGLLDGISGMAQSLVNKATEIANSIISAITKPFDIHSPSRRMAWVGQMIDTGLAEGIEDNSEDPVAQMERMASQLFDEAIPMPEALTEQYAAADTSPQTAYGADPSLLNRLDRILRAIEAGRIIALDGDKLVGATITRIDSALGDLQNDAERGMT